MSRLCDGDLGADEAPPGGGERDAKSVESECARNWYQWGLLSRLRLSEHTAMVHVRMVHIKMVHVRIAR